MVEGRFVALLSVRGSEGDESPDGVVSGSVLGMIVGGLKVHAGIIRFGVIAGSS